MPTPLKVEIGATVDEVPLVSEYHQASTSNLSKPSEYIIISLPATLAYLESELVPTIAIQLREVNPPNFRPQLRGDFDNSLSCVEERSRVGVL